MRQLGSAGAWTTMDKNLKEHGHGEIWTAQQLVCAKGCVVDLHFSNKKLIPVIHNLKTKKSSNVTEIWIPVLYLGDFISKLHLRYI